MTDENNKKLEILKEDAPLYIDVTCYDCKRTVALSNTREIDGRRYCFRCSGDSGRLKELKDR